MWLTECGNSVDIDDMPHLATDDIMDDLNVVRAHLSSHGLTRTIVVDLTRKELNIPVERVIVPGLEVYAIDEDRAGRRLMNYVGEGR